MAVFTVPGSGDDANEVVSSGAMSYTLDGTTTGARLDGTNHAAFRFTGVTIANAATIASAYLRFPQLNNYSGLAATVANITPKLQAADSPINFGLGTNDISARSRTTATGTMCNDSPNSGGSNNIDVTTCVQEVVNRAGWSSGNAMVVLLIGSGSAGTNWIQPYMWDYFSGTYAATLTITTGAGATTTISTAMMMGV